MKKVGTCEAKTHLPRLLSEVQEGETIVITNRGVPVARLLPPEVVGAPADILERGRRIRASAKPLGPGGVKALIEEGRRF